jgi:glycosyltransferase involved in cell wall biosynthesis
MRNIIVNANFLTYPMVGTTRVAIEICRQLIKQGYALTFLSPKKIQLHEIAKEFNVKKIGFFSGMFWEQLELPIYLLSKRKSVLLSFTNSAPLFYPYNIMALLDIIPLVNPEWVSKKDYFKSVLFTALLVKTSLKIFTISEYSKTDIIQKFKIKPEKIKVIYCGVKPLSYDSEELNTPDLTKNKYILAVSSLEPRKNFINVIKAFNLLENINLRLVLVGPNFKYHIHDLMPFINIEKTIIKGYVSDKELAQLYNNALTFVYPSLYEGFGLPPLEAMLYNCPVVTSNVTSIPEVCGDAVLYADPHSPQDIADKIKLLEVNSALRKKMVLKGREKAKQYTWERSVRLLLECINSVT